jgi:hypothetical protein
LASRRAQRPVRMKTAPSGLTLRWAFLSQASRSSG